MFKIGLVDSPMICLLPHPRAQFLAAIGLAVIDHVTGLSALRNLQLHANLQELVPSFKPTSEYHQNAYRNYIAYLLDDHRLAT
jgi:hypothetical protein